jgi:3-oxoacyl-[acyl-carrier protein] reductase
MGVALVTGGSRGIGRAIALCLAGDGHDVAVGYLSQEEAAKGVAEEIRALGRRAARIPADLGDPGAPASLVDQAEAELGAIEILVANAGINSAPTGIADIADADWERMQSINLRAPFLLARRLAPQMCRRGFGRIVLISSIAAYTGGMIGAHYAASKAGLHGLGYSLAWQTAAYGVTVNIVAPALVESDMIPDDEGIREHLVSSSPVGRLGRPEEVADIVAAVVRNGYLTGKSILLDGGRHPA